MKKIAVGDLGEFWYGDYKEPFTQLEGAVPGYPRGVLLYQDEDGTPGNPTCAYCGKAFRNLGSHLKLHGFSAAEYKRETGLLAKSSLVSEKVRVEMAARMRDRLEKGEIEGIKPGQKLPSPTLRAAGATAAMRRPEYQNKTGRCYQQVLAVASQAAREGKNIGRTTLARYGIERGTVAQHFGSYANLAKLIQGKQHKAIRRYTDRQLLEILRTNAAVIGRTPTRSDLRRFGLPSPTTYGKRFGSYSEACRRAGLEPRVPTPIGRGDEVEILALYSTWGSVEEVARLVSRRQQRVSDVLVRYGINLRRGSSAMNDWHLKERAKAAEVARRLAGWPEEAAA